MTNRVFSTATIIFVAFVCITNAFNSIAEETKIALTVETAYRVDTGRVSTTVIDFDFALIDFFTDISISVETRITQAIKRAFRGFTVELISYILYVENEIYKYKTNLNRSGMFAFIRYQFKS